MDGALGCEPRGWAFESPRVLHFTEKEYNALSFNAQDSDLLNRISGLDSPQGVQIDGLSSKAQDSNLLSCESGLDSPQVIQSS